MTDKPNPISARDIEVPSAFNTAEPLSDMPVAAQLVLLKRAIGPGVNRNDVGDTLIEAAIGAGVHGKGAIIDLLQGLGFSRGHVGMLLEKGADAESPKWTRDEAKRYRLRDRR